MVEEFSIAPRIIDLAAFWFMTGGLWFLIGASLMAWTVFNLESTHAKAGNGASPPEHEVQSCILVVVQTLYDILC